MPIVKARYTLAWKGGSASARASLTYMAQRPNIDGQEGKRTLFSAQAEDLSAADGLRIIDEGRGNHYYRLILNPGAGSDPEVDLKSWTREVMADLEENRGRAVHWVAVVHDDHTRHAHVHVQAVTDGLIRKPELNLFREAANKAWTEELKVQQELRQDVLALENETKPNLEIRQVALRGPEESL
jgi:hypothetical protein